MSFNSHMKTIDDIRREWLAELISRHGTIANLNIALGLSRTDGTLSQIKNQAKDSKTGKPRVMGTKLAREIEEKLGLEIGTLDHSIDDIRKYKELESYYEADIESKAVIELIINSNFKPPPEWSTPDMVAQVNAMKYAALKWLQQPKRNTA